MKPHLFMSVFACLILSGASIYGMQSHVQDVDAWCETESDSDDERTEQPSGWDVGSFISSQVAGAGSLLRYGRRAAEDLVTMIGSSSAHEQALFSSDAPAEREQAKAVGVSLVTVFLRDFNEYALLVKCLPSDMRLILARCLMRKHPLANVINARLGRHVCLHTLQGHDGPVYSAQFNGARDRIITASDDGTAKIWDVASGECLRTLLGHSRTVHSAQFTSAGDRIVTAAYDDTVRIWDVTSGECLQTLQGNGSKFYSAQFNSAARDRIITASDDGTAKILDVASGECLQTLQGHGSKFYSAQFNSAGDRIVTLSADNTAKIWDSASGECLHTLKKIHRGSLMSAQFNGAGDRIVTTSGSTAMIWDVASGECLRMLHEHHWRMVYSAQFNCAGDRIVIASSDSTAKIKDSASGACLHTLQGHGTYVLSAQFNSAGDRIVTASHDKTAKIWDSGRLFAVTAWLERDCTFEQALLLHCIYETRITHALLKKRNRAASVRFDFNTCPHLQEYFDTMPAEVQACLAPFVIRKT